MGSRFDNIKKNTSAADMVFFILFVCSACYSLFLAPYGWTGSDEAYYILQPFRFTQGDSFFVDDWNNGQLFSLVILPLMKLHLQFAPSTDGIILSFRYYYVAIAALVSLLIYLRTRSISKLGALFAAMMLLLYSPLSVRNLSYNSIGLMSLALCCVLAFTAGRRAFLDLYLAGICLAATVLCCPFVVAHYVIYALFVLILSISRKRSGRLAEYFPCYAFSPKGLLAVTLGCGTLFIYFCFAVLHGSSLAGIVENFHYLFLDPEHVPTSIFWLAKNVIYCSITSSPIALECAACCGLVALAILFDKKRIAHRAVYLFLGALLSLVYCLPYVNSNICNELMLPINILGLCAYVLSENRQKKIFRLVFVPGLIYAICMHHASSLRYQALCHGFAICAIASAFFIVNIIQELRRESRHSSKALLPVLCFALSLLLPAQLAAEAYGRATNFFHDTAFETLDTKLDRGAQLGLITSSEHARDYYAIYDDTEFIRNADGEYVTYVCDKTWPPLSDAKRSAIDSVWTNYDKPEASAKLLREYLIAHPEKHPEYIYVTKTLTYTYQDDIDGMVIVDIINIENKPVTETETGYVIHMK